MNDIDLAGWDGEACFELPVRREQPPRRLYLKRDDESQKVLRKACKTHLVARLLRNLLSTAAL